MLPTLVVCVETCFDQVLSPGVCASRSTRVAVGILTGAMAAVFERPADRVTQSQHA